MLHLNQAPSQFYLFLTVDILYTICQVLWNILQFSGNNPESEKQTNSITVYWKPTFSLRSPRDL